MHLSPSFLLVLTFSAASGRISDVLGPGPVLENIHSLNLTSQDSSIWVSVLGTSIQGQGWESIQNTMFLFDFSAGIDVSWIYSFRKAKWIFWVTLVIEDLGGGGTDYM